MTTMNGLPRSLDPFIKGICSRRKLTKFSRLWEDFTQEEARLEAREEKLGDEENQDLEAHARKGRNKRHHANDVEYEEPIQKKERNNESDEEYVLISTLIGTITHGNDTWLVDSGASKHMTGYKDYHTDLVENESHHTVKIGNDY